MLRYILCAVVMFLALEGLAFCWLRLASALSGRPPRGCVFTVEVCSAAQAEHALECARRFHSARLAGYGVRFAVRCSGGAEAAEICRRFCGRAGLSYSPEMLYNKENTDTGE